MRFLSDAQLLCCACFCGVTWYRWYAGAPALAHVLCAAPAAANSTAAQRDTTAWPLGYLDAFRMGEASLACAGAHAPGGQEEEERACAQALDELSKAVGEPVTRADTASFEARVRQKDASPGLTLRLRGLLSLANMLFALGALVFCVTVVPFFLFITHHLWSFLGSMMLHFLRLCLKGLARLHTMGVLLSLAVAFTSTSVLADTCATRPRSRELGGAVSWVLGAATVVYSFTVFPPKEPGRWETIEALSFVSCVTSAPLALALRSTLLSHVSTAALFLSLGMVPVPLPWGLVLGFAGKTKVITVLCVGTTLMLTSASLEVWAQGVAPLAALRLFRAPATFFGLHAANTAALALSTPCYSRDHWAERQGTAVAVFAAEIALGSVLPAHNARLQYGGFAYTFFFVVKLLLETSWSRDYVVVVLFVSSLAVMRLAWWLADDANRHVLVALVPLP